MRQGLNKGQVLEKQLTTSEWWEKLIKALLLKRPEQAERSIVVGSTLRYIDSISQIGDLMSQAEGYTPKGRRDV